MKTQSKRKMLLVVYENVSF